MFAPNTTGLLFAAGATDKFGQNTFQSTGVSVACAVVKLDPTVEKTPIRSTGSASRGEADELVDPAIVLFPPESTIKLLDELLIYGSRLRCIEVSPQISVAGVIDHYECSFEAA